MKTEPKVSVITTCHNEERYVEGAIKSIRRQSFAAFEHIVIDNGSTDETARVIESYAAQDPRIRPVYQKNVGIPRAMNRGLELSRGVYIAVLDSDDLAFPDRLERQVVCLDRSPQVALVGAAEVAFDVRTQKTWLVRHPTKDADIRRAWAYRQVFTHSATMMRSSVVDSVGGYDEQCRLGVDPDLWIRIAERAEVANLSEPLVIRRYHAGQFSRGRRPIDVLQRMKLKYRAIKQLRLPLHHYLYLAVPLMSVAPDPLKQAARRLAGHHGPRHGPSLDPTLIQLLVQSEAELDSQGSR